MTDPDVIPITINLDGGFNIDLDLLKKKFQFFETPHNRVTAFSLYILALERQLAYDPAIEVKPIISKVELRRLRQSLHTASDSHLRSELARALIRLRQLDKEYGVQVVSNLVPCKDMDHKRR